MSYFNDIADRLLCLKTRSADGKRDSSMGFSLLWIIEELRIYIYTNVATDGRGKWKAFDLERLTPGDSCYASEAADGGR